jgi:DNA primase
VIQEPETRAEAPPGEGRPFYMFSKCMEAVKAGARIEDYAGELTALRFNGKSLRGVCPIHNGENRSSFAVYPERQRWYCFRCNEGGDVVDLCQAVEDHSEHWTAMLSLAQRYEIDLPERPPSWAMRQEEKAADRKRILRVIRESYRRRFFRVYAPIVLDLIEDEEERNKEASRIWEALYTPAYHAALRRVDRGIHA